MQAQGQNMFPVCQLDELDTQGHVLIEPERLCNLIVHDFLHRFFSLLRFNMTQVSDRQEIMVGINRHQSALRVSFSIFQYDGAKSMVSFDQGPKGLTKCLDVQITSQAQCHWNNVGSRFTVYLVKCPQASLAIGKRNASLSQRTHA